MYLCFVLVIRALSTCSHDFFATHQVVAVVLPRCTGRLTSEKVGTARVQHLSVTRFNSSYKINEDQDMPAYKLLIIKHCQNA